MKHYKIKTIILGVIALLSMSPYAQAINFTFTDDFVLESAGSDKPFLYKDNVGGGEEGPLSGSYETAYSYLNNEISGFTISYDSGNVATAATLFVKAGSFLYSNSLAGWNGMDDINVTVSDGDLPGGVNGIQGISHVTISGTELSVPDTGSTLIMLGFVALLLGGAAPIRKSMALS